MTCESTHAEQRNIMGMWPSEGQFLEIELRRKKGTYFEIFLLYCITATAIADVYDNRRAVTAKSMTVYLSHNVGNERQVSEPAFLWGGLECTHFSIKRWNSQSNIVVIKEKVRVHLLASHAPKQQVQISVLSRNELRVPGFRWVGRKPVSVNNFAHFRVNEVVERIDVLANEASDLKQRQSARSCSR